MTLIEVERKRAVSDGPALRRRLTDLGYHTHNEETESDVYYSRPDVDYMETVECLRIRRRDGFSEITYKPPTNPTTHGVGHIIAKQEINVPITDPDQARLLLEAVDMRQLAVVEKARSVFRHPDRHDTVIALDTVTGVGEFVETEVTAADASHAARHLGQVERTLDITEWPVVTLPYRDLVMATQGATR